MVADYSLIALKVFALVHDCVEALWHHGGRDTIHLRVMLIKALIVMIALRECKAHALAIYPAERDHGLHEFGRIFSWRDWHHRHLRCVNDLEPSRGAIWVRLRVMRYALGRSAEHVGSRVCTDVTGLLGAVGVGIVIVEAFV